MVFMVGIKDHVEIACVYTRFPNPRHLDLEAIDRQAAQHAQQLFLIGTKIKQRSYEHVPAHTGRTLKV